MLRFFFLALVGLLLTGSTSLAGDPIDEFELDGLRDRVEQLEFDRLLHHQPIYPFMPGPMPYYRYYWWWDGRQYQYRYFWIPSAYSGQPYFQNPYYVPRRCWGLP